MSSKADQIKQKLDMLSVLKHYGVNVSGGGRPEQIKCPFHDDTRPSARYYPDTDSIYCWRCGKTWDVIEFVRDQEGITFSEACDFLERVFRLDVAVPDYERKFWRGLARLQNAVSGGQSLEETVIEAARGLNGRARGYLYERGLTEELIERLEIGYARSGFFRRRVVIPFWSKGRLVSAVGRWLGDPSDGVARYYEWPGPARLFNEDVLDASDEMFLCEGVFDALSLMVADFPAVAVPGQRGFREEWVPRILDKRLYICYDMDAPGEEGAQEVLKLVKGKAAAVVRMRWAGAKDVNEFFCRRRWPSLEFRGLIKEGERWA